jgi:hypothetical protein
MVSVDLPPPDTPVTQTNLASGNSAVTFLRLLPVALTTVSVFLLPGRRTERTGIARVPDRYWPVTESGLAAISAGVPQATTCPPCTPAPGPMSNT